MKWVLPTLSALVSVAVAEPQEAQLRSYSIDGDAIAVSLTQQAGNAGRGASLMQQRQKSLCVLCHSGPFPDAHLQGSLAPDLTGVGDRLSAGQLRLRIVDMKRVSPASIMPTYYAIANNADLRVAAQWRNKPILDAGEIEDLVAYLQTLKQ
jgi:L-cysteine S-thiosulfotransferase